VSSDTLIQQEPRWLTRLEVIAIAYDQLIQHGGYQGLLEQAGLLEAAIGRPRNKYHYEGAADLADLAAAYTFAIVKTSHPFLDGNKRTGFMAAYTFLGMNGYDFVVPAPDVVSMIFRLAAGRVTEEALAVWFREHMQPLDSRDGTEQSP
jgi:death-on-curing protein